MSKTPHVSWYNTSFNGKIVAYHIARLHKRAKKLEKELASEFLKPKQRLLLEIRHDSCVDKIAFLSNCLTAAQRQRLREREVVGYGKFCCQDCWLPIQRNIDDEIIAEVI